MLINGYDTSLPFRNRDVKVNRVSQFAVQIEAFGLSIIWVPHDEILTIKIEPIYAGKVKGLCGTFNWNKKVIVLSPLIEPFNTTKSFTKLPPTKNSVMYTVIPYHGIDVPYSFGLKGHS